MNLTTAIPVPVVAEPIRRLARDINAAVADLAPDEARYLVDLYYVIQEDRKRAGNQSDALGRQGEPHTLITWLGGNMETLESNIKRALDHYSDKSELGRWAKSIVGIGPVISVGLLTHIDITKAPTVGHIWRFAGLDPTVTWEKGQKRPWNASLKTLTWKAGQSFMKFQNHPRDTYGKLYIQRKAFEQEQNEAGLYADQAARMLATKRFKPTTAAHEWYTKGKLPPAQIDARARRWAVKLFLAHYHHVAYEIEYHTPPPRPYILTQPGHVHFIAPPNWPM